MTKGSEAYRAGYYHATIDRPSNLEFYTKGTFGWFDYLEGQWAGYNERYWSERRFGLILDAEALEAKRDAIKAILKEAGRS